MPSANRHPAPTSTITIACSAPYGAGGLGQHLAQVVQETPAAGRLRSTQLGLRTLGPWKQLARAAVGP
jgi:hypothetical protein